MHQFNWEYESSCFPWPSATRCVVMVDNSSSAWWKWRLSYLPLLSGMWCVSLKLFALLVCVHLLGRFLTDLYLLFLYDGTFWRRMQIPLPSTLSLTVLAFSTAENITCILELVYLLWILDLGSSFMASLISSQRECFSLSSHQLSIGPQLGLRYLEFIPLWV